MITKQKPSPRPMSIHIGKGSRCGFVQFCQMRRQRWLGKGREKDRERCRS